jgi:acetolactate synthase I/II/III large subunit
VRSARVKGWLIANHAHAIDGTTVPARRAMSSMTTAEAVLDSLLRRGIDTLYALPGVHNDHLFDAAQRAGDRFRVIHTRHEQTAAYMALGAALVTGRPQALAVVPGPGLLNASAAMLTAYGMGAPVLALVGQIPSFAIDRGHGHLHELHDQLGLMRHFTRFAARIESPLQAPGLVDAAVRVAGAAPQGPVALECAIDTWGSRGPAEPTSLAPQPEMPIDREAISHAARLLGAAKRPLIVVGGGALGAGPEVQAVAELLNAPVCSFRRGRGTIPTSHRLAVSFTEGHHFWKGADAVLAIGTRLYWQESTWGVDERLPIVRIDADPAAFDRFHRPACALLGDAAPVLRAMLAVLCKHNRPRPDRQGELDAARAWFSEALGRLQPQGDFLAAIRAALPPSGIFVEDVTQLGFVSRLAWPVAEPRLYLSPGYQDNLGWAYGAALGAQAALPGRKVVAVMGDGGFMYQAQEVATAMRHKLPVVGVVFDDGAFGNVRRIQEQQYSNRLIAYDLHNPDFVAYSRCFGAAGFRAETPAALESALREAFALNRPALVHVPCGQMPSPWDMILLPRVRGFADAWRPALP